MLTLTSDRSDGSYSRDLWSPFRVYIDNPLISWAGYHHCIGDKNCRMSKQRKHSYAQNRGTS